MQVAAMEYCLGSLSQIPAGEGREFNAGGTQIAVFHSRNGGIYATQARCPHREGPLVDGLLGGASLMCPLHAWKFDLTTGETLNGTCGITTYRVWLDDDYRIMVKLGE